MYVGVGGVVVGFGHAFLVDGSGDGVSMGRDVSIIPATICAVCILQFLNGIYESLVLHHVGVCFPYGRTNLPIYSS